MSGCRTTDEVMRDFNADFSAGTYRRGADETASRAESGGADRLLWHQLAASGYRLCGVPDEALRHLDAAEQCYAANDTRGVFASGTATATAMMVNDTLFDYDGGGVDRVFTCLYKAIDFLDAGNADLARVELNRAGQYQQNWLYDRRREIADAKKRFDSDANDYMRSQKVGSSNAGERASQVGSALADRTLRDKFIENCGFDPATGGDVEAIASSGAYMNAYALHVIGLFRWLTRSSDRNELRDAAAMRLSPGVVKRDAAECRDGATPRDQVWVFIEDGLCPARSEWRCDLPLFVIPGARDYLPYVAMAFPTLQNRGAGANWWYVEGEQPELLCDVDALVKTEYDIYMKGAVTREITRTVIRAGMEIALGILAEEHKKQNDYWAYKLGQVGVAVWAAACTKADLRSWTALPKRVLVARIARPESGVVGIRADGESFSFDVPPGNSMVFLRKPGPNAPTVVKKYTCR